MYMYNNQLCQLTAPGERGLPGLEAGQQSPAARTASSDVRRLQDAGERLGRLPVRRRERGRLRQLQHRARHLSPRCVRNVRASTSHDAINRLLFETQQKSRIYAASLISLTALNTDKKCIICVQR